MCGISGEILSNRNEPSLLTSLAHRGPDFKGKFENSNIVLIHDRLSIVDLSELSNQPMLNSRFVLLFNGEIYNYKSLRAKYEQLGYHFISSGDTEVILAGFTLLGISSFDLLDGMFSIAVYDLIENKIFLVRDQFGIKPLYYFLNNNSFAFSSEIRGFSDNIRNKVNGTARVLFWSFGFVPGPETHICDVFSLIPGSVFVFDLKTLSFSFLRKLETVRNKYMANQELGDILMKNFKLTYADEVESAISLSGGLDSSLLSEMFIKNGFHNVKAISLYTSKFKFSEEIYQKRISEYLKLNTEFIDTNGLHFREEYYNHIDSPTIDGYNMFILTKIAKQRNIKVVYSGLGGDELFFGYSKYRVIKYLTNLPKIFLPLFRLYNKRFNWINDFNFASVYLVSRTVNSPDYIANHLGIDKDEIIRIVNGYFYEHYNQELTETNWDLTNWDLRFYTMNQLLRDGDIFAMSNSVEVRFPFLLREIIDFSYSSSALGLQGPNSNKELLRKVATYGLLKAISPKKQGFHIGNSNILISKNQILFNIDKKFFK